jgi:hypothetical protein
VTLVEQYPPGHVRAASGGESRLIRFSHGESDWYTRSSRRALDLWRELERETGRELFVPSGVAWFFSGSHGWGDESERLLNEQGIATERLEPGEGTRLYPSFDGTGLASILYEPEAGVLRARDATRAISELAVERGRAFRDGNRGFGRRRRPGRRRPPGGRPSRLGVRRLARDRLPRRCRPPRDPAGRLLLRRAGGLAGARRSRVGRLRQRRLRRRRPRRARLQGEPRPRGTSVRPRLGRAGRLDEKEQEARDYLATRFPALADAPLVGTRSCRTRSPRTRTS